MALPLTHVPRLVGQKLRWDQIRSFTYLAKELCQFLCGAKLYLQGHAATSNFCVNGQFSSGGWL